jgi:cytochrome c biogenesis protein CcmG/thiol:disulfide interchange protein DsbE
LPSTPSSAEGPTSRRLSRGAIVALILVSLAIPAGALALILHADNNPADDAASTGPVVTPEKAKIGSLAPDFTLPDLDGNAVTLSALRGRVVVLAFFASWCHPCEQDMPILERAQRDVGDRIAVVGVNYQDFPNDSRDFLRRLGVTFPALIEDSTGNPVAARYDVHAMPDTLFIDANGIVRDRLFGPTSRHDLESAINALLRA